MHYVQFSRGIDPANVHQLIQVMEAIANDPDRDVTLLINSGGGQVVAGIHCYNILMSLPINLTTHNVGNVDSIANVIFLAGAQRAACSPSTFMFHSVGFDQAGPVRLEESNLRQWLNSVIADNQRIGSIIAARTNLTRGSAGGLFRQQRTRDAAWALRHGFVHQIADPVIPAGTNIVQLL